jgi:hypothetical protein
MEVKESDWKKYKKSADLALQRLEQNCISKVQLIASNTSIPDERKILEIGETIANHKSLEKLMFGDFRRSTMVMALAQMVSHGLVSGSDLLAFSPELQEQVTAICGSING